MAGLIVSAVINFWVGIGSNVLIPPPPILHVGTQMCDYFNNTCNLGSENSTNVVAIVRLDNATTTMTPDVPVDDNL